MWVESSSSSPVEGMTACGATSSSRRILAKDGNITAAHLSGINPNGGFRLMERSYRQRGGRRGPAPRQGRDITSEPRGHICLTGAAGASANRMSVR